MAKRDKPVDPNTGDERELEQQPRGGAREEPERRAGAEGSREHEREGAGQETDEELEETILSAPEVLAALGQLDLESALAYEAAAELAGDAEIARQLRGFGRDHRRHVERLARALEAEGDEGLAPSPDAATGMLAELARLSGPLGPGPLAMSLLANEQLTNLSYEDALAYEWDEERERMLEEFRSDEERHMRWLSDHYEEMERSSGEQQPGAAE